MIEVGCASCEAAPGLKRCGVERLWGEFVQQEHKRPWRLALRTRMDVLTTTPNLHLCVRDRRRLAARASLRARTRCGEVLLPSPLLRSGSRRCTPECVHRLCVLSHHYLKMAAIRFILFIALLLGVALLAAPHQVTAEAPINQCYTNMSKCLGHRLRCRDCVTYCVQAARQLKGFVGTLADFYATRCGRFAR